MPPSIAINTRIAKSRVGAAPRKMPKQKARLAKQPTGLKLLGNLQKRFVIWAGKSSMETLSETLCLFVPERELFWEAALKAGMSRQEYETRLLNRSKIRRRIGGINRGARLVLSAASWKKPMVGDGKGIARARGLQWRTTVAWTGLELIGASLFERINNCEADNVFEWCHLLGLATLDEEIRVPGGLKRSAKIRNLWKDEVEILEFLEVRGGKPKRTLDAWWVKRTPIGDHAAALQAARAIRDVTSHGLLSASRVAKFGLVSSKRNRADAPLDRLIEVIVAVAIETLRKFLNARSRANPRRIGARR